MNRISHRILPTAPITKILNQMLPRCRAAVLVLATIAIFSTASFGLPVTEIVPPGTDISKLTLKANTIYYCAGAVTQSANITLPTGTSFDGRTTGTLTIAKTVGLAFNCIYPGCGVTGFKLITGSTATVLISCGSKGGADGCFFTHNTTADGWNECFQTVGGGTHFNFSDNTIGICNQYPVYVVDDYLTCDYNTFRGSIGQYVIRLTNGGPGPQPKGAHIVGNIIDQRVNQWGKQAVGFRYAEGFMFAANTIYGCVRIGEGISTNDPTARCDGFSVTNNIWIQTATNYSAHTNALEVDGGSTGNVAGNIFQSQGDLDSPIMVYTNNAVTISDNTQQFTATQPQMPLIPTSADPACYHNLGGNTVVIVP